LAGFCGMLVYFETDSALDRLLNLVSDRSSCNRPLLRGLGESLDALTAGAVYEVCRRVIQSLRQEDAKDILLATLRRLVNALPDSAEVRFDITDIPRLPTDAIARFLFALMSDVDTRVRWRAAHCLRRFVRYGGKELLPSIAVLSKRTAEDSFRVPRAPFYWQAARLWFVATLSRIASEQPGAVLLVKTLLLQTLDDPAYPHPALRSFAKDALEALASSGMVSFGEHERVLIRSTNRSSIPPEARVSLFPAEASLPGPSGRFRFDPMDTVPYWYQPATRIFANVSMNQLKAEAERWILDRWGVKPDVVEWRTEPRRNRFPERSWRLSSNDHGSKPRLEHYKTFLEWYALQCAIGSLMKIEPLAVRENGEHTELETRLRWQRPSETPCWIADLLSPIPLEERFWLQPKIGEEWVAAVSDADFVQELQRGTDGSEIVVDGSFQVSSSEFSWDVDVDSALVNEENAMALVRALQTGTCQQV
jgi:hypothetical protein